MRRQATSVAVIATLSVALMSRLNASASVDCENRVFNAPDMGAVLEAVHARAAASAFTLQYRFHGGRSADAARYIAVSVDGRVLAVYSAAPRPDIDQQISLFSLKPGAHRIYIEFMNNEGIRGTAPIAVEACTILPRGGMINRWEFVP